MMSQNSSKKAQYQRKTKSTQCEKHAYVQWRWFITWKGEGYYRKKTHNIQNYGKMEQI